MNLPDRLVIDASVAAKWFLKDAMESDVDLANDILLDQRGRNNPPASIRGKTEVNCQ